MPTYFFLKSASNFSKSYCNALSMNVIYILKNYVFKNITECRWQWKFCAHENIQKNTAILRRIIISHINNMIDLTGS
jgi:hypothetical protein